MNDLISRNEAIERLLTEARKEGAYGYIDIVQIITILNELTPVEHWIPIRYHETTEDEIEYGLLSEECLCAFECDMPEDGQQILIQTFSGYIMADECYVDNYNCYSLESGYNFIEEVVAWMPLPEPYKEELTCTKD